MKKAIFWDLLGTLGGDSKTLITNFKFFDESIAALKLAQKKGFLNIVITNQSHIAHGRLTLKEYETGLEEIKKKLNTQSISIEKFFTCPHKRSDRCECKKPLPELVFRAQKEFDIDLSKSYVIGDTVKNDIELAHHTGMKGILVLTGGESDNEIEQRKLVGMQLDDWTADHALTAVKMITKKKSPFNS